MRKPVFEDSFVQRRLVIDHLLDKEIAAGRVTQVVEIASGLSGRAVIFTQKYGDKIRYVETDLRGVLETKKKLYADQGFKLANSHIILELNALADDGDNSLNGLIDKNILKLDEGTVIITEGLISYFNRETVASLFSRFSRFLNRFPHGVYLTHTAPFDIFPPNWYHKLTRALRNWVSKTSNTLDFKDGNEVQQMLKDNGFIIANVLDPKSFDSEIPKVADTVGKACYIIVASPRK